MLSLEKRIPIFMKIELLVYYQSGQTMHGNTSNTMIEKSPNHVTF